MKDGGNVNIKVEKDSQNERVTLKWKHFDEDKTVTLTPDKDFIEISEYQRGWGDEEANASFNPSYLEKMSTRFLEIYPPDTKVTVNIADDMPVQITAGETEYFLAPHIGV